MDCSPRGLFLFPGNTRPEVMIFGVFQICRDGYNIDALAEARQPAVVKHHVHGMAAFAKLFHRSGYGACQAILSQEYLLTGCSEFAIQQRCQAHESRTCLLDVLRCGCHWFFLLPSVVAAVASCHFIKYLIKSHKRWA